MTRVNTLICAARNEAEQVDGQSQIANLLMIVSDGELVPYRPIVDDSGVDLVVGAKGTFQTIFLQIKSQFVTNSRYKHRLDFQIRKETFAPSSQMQALLVYFDQSRGEIDTMWLVPSTELISGAVERDDQYRLSASRSDESSDKWSRFKVTQAKLVEVLRTRLTGRWN